MAKKVSYNNFPSLFEPPNTHLYGRGMSQNRQSILQELQEVSTAEVRKSRDEQKTEAAPGSLPRSPVWLCSDKRRISAPYRTN